jgi:hypothetical protein
MITDFFLKLNIAQIVALIILIIGFVVFSLAMISIFKSVLSKSWTTTIGKVIKSEIYTSRDNDANAMYRPDIAFEYIVNGEKYMSDRLYYGVKIMSSGNWINSRKLLEKYPVDKEIIVYYDPDRPIDSVIEPGIHFSLGGFFIFSICFIILGLVIYLNSDFVLRLFEQSK